MDMNLNSTDKTRDESRDSSQEGAIHKKVISACIMDILEKNSDPEHRLSLDEIVELIPRYGYTAQRKAVGDHLTKLCELFDGTDKQIYYTQTQGDHPRRTGYYLDPEPTIQAGELDTLINYIRYNRNIQPDTKKSLIKRLKSVGPAGYRYTEGLLNEEWRQGETYDDFFGNMEIIGDAIRHKHQISFDLYRYDETAEMHHISGKTIFFNPFHVVSKNDRYYIIGTENGEKEIRHYRVDQIKYIQEEKTALAMPENLTHSIQTYLNTHPDMTEGLVVRIQFDIRNDSIGKLADYFGPDFQVDPRGDARRDYMRVTVNATEESAFRWALEHSDIASVRTPQSLRCRLRIAAEDISGTYGSTPEDAYENALIRANKRPYEFVCGKLDLRRKTEFHALDPQSVRLYHTQLEDISFVRNFTHLRNLELVNNPVEDGSPLSAVRELQRLVLQKTGIRALDFIRDLPSLRELDLYQNPMNDYAPLYDCESLEFLRLSPEEAQKIDLDALKKRNPKLTVEASVKRPLIPMGVRISYREELDTRLTDAPYPASVYEWLIGQMRAEIAPEEKAAVYQEMAGDTAYLSACREAMEALSDEQREVAEAMLMHHMTYREVSRKFTKKMETVINIMRTVQREFRDRKIRIVGQDYYPRYFCGRKDPLVRHMIK